MSSAALIPYRSHRRWVQDKLLLDPSFKLFLARVQPGKRAFGLTQLRIAEDTAEIGVIFREPDQHRMVTAVATIATIHAAFDYFRLRWLISYVLPEHKAAIRFNKDFGAWEEPSDRADMVRLRLNRESFRCSRRSHRLFARMCADYHLWELASF